MSSIVKASEMAAVQRWYDEHFACPAAPGWPCHFPVSFRYGGRPSAELLPGWLMQELRVEEQAGMSCAVITVADPQTGLECRCDVKLYADFPALEWVARFRNNGAEDTPVLSDIQPLNALFPLSAVTPCVVHHARGGLTQRDDFEPLQTPLTFRQGGGRLQLSAATGKPSTLHLPFFNLAIGDGGVIGAIGWTGGWTATFERRPEGIQVRAGMERTHLVLHPGEEIRTPRVLLLFWEDDRTRSQNLLRRLILAHYTPRPGGQPLQPPFAEGAWGGRTAESHLAKIAWLAEQKLGVDCYWIDAAWYGDPPIAEVEDGLNDAWAKYVGSWYPNPAAYPDGFRPIGEAAAAAGLDFLLWIEPERAYEGSQMVREHPEWLLGPVQSAAVRGQNYMVNLGIPEARQAITELVSGIISEGQVTWYRQDFNALVVPALLAMADAPDRIGMAEIRHVEGLYAFWDELLARHPGLRIDNCAGGGQRIDLETISRSVPLWRSDLQCWPFDPVAMQTQTQGLAPWVPLSAAVCEQPTAYAMRSALGPGLVTHWSSHALEAGLDLPLDSVRRLMGEARALRHYFYGDYYPLLSFSLAADAWAAWQYDRPDLGEGLIVAFRRHESPFPTWEGRLQGLDPNAEYELRSWDDGGMRRLSGRELMVEGFTVTIAEQPGSALFTYRRLV